MQSLRTLSSFRDKVRQLALDKKDPKEYLKLCDELRDVHLAELGIALDDQKGTNQYTAVSRLFCKPKM